MSTPLLEVTDLRKAYRVGGTVVQAVDRLSFTLAPGGSIGLVGESGSGKTTTARMLIGLEEPDEGSILVNGTPLAPTRHAAGRPGWSGPGPCRSSGRTPTSPSTRG